MLLIGTYTPASCASEESIDRGAYGEGFVYKNEDTFLHHPDEVCYIPELSDEKYTRNSLVEICGGNEELARSCFYELDWAHPESWLEDCLTSSILTKCEKCGFVYDNGDDEAAPCPRCSSIPQL